MPDISYLLDSLSSKIVQSKITYKDLPDIEGILFLRNQNFIPDNYILLANGKDLANILNNLELNSHSTIITSGKYGKLPEFANNKYVNLIATSIDLVDLYNNVCIIVNQYQKWSAILKWTDLFMKSDKEESNVKSLINEVSTLLKSPIFLLDENYKIIYSSTDFLKSDIFVQELTQNGYLSTDSVENLFGSDIPIKNSKKVHLTLYSDITQNTYYIEQLDYQNNTNACLMIITDSTNVYNNIAELNIQIAGYVEKRLIYEYIENLNINTGLSSFIGDILELRLTDVEDIRNGFIRINHPLNKFINCIVIEFIENYTKKPPLNTLINQLGQILPGNNITAYNGDIVIIFSQNQQVWQWDFDYEKLDALLIKYNAYAGVSNGTSRYDMIRTMFLLAKSSLRLGKALDNNKTKRIFTQEEYSMFSIIDLCAKTFVLEYKHSDLIYLVHPAIMYISRYDLKHKSNLVEVLFQYLINDRNLVKASKAMFMHRNTMVNKIAKITEIIGESLENGQLQLRLLFSCLMLRYYEDYLKANINF